MRATVRIVYALRACLLGERNDDVRNDFGSTTEIRPERSIYWKNKHVEFTLSRQNPRPIGEQDGFAVERTGKRSRRYVQVLWSAYRSARP